PRLQISFDVSGEHWQLSHPNGKPFTTFGELMAQSQAAQQEAQVAQQRLQQAVPRLLSMGLNREQVADALALTVEDVEAIAINL
nr:Uma2 family endonuclease [Desmonostoc geniculatum HA4340-LM1]